MFKISSKFPRTDAGEVGVQALRGVVVVHLTLPREGTEAEGGPAAPAS